MQVFDLQRHARERAADMEFRKMVEHRRIVHDRHRAVEEKAETLRAIADSSAVMGGLTFYAYVEFKGCPGNTAALIATYEILSTLSICLFCISAALCTFLLVAVYKFDCEDDSLDFASFFDTFCQ